MPGAHESTVEPPIARLRRLGLRVTPQRLLVLEALAAHGGHVTVEQIQTWAAARYAAINAATIYRTLDVLIAAGLVSETNLGTGAAQFELLGEAPHHHLVCATCGAVKELDDAALVPLRERLLREHGFQPQARHLAIFGTCRACREGAHPASDRASP